MSAEPRDLSPRLAGRYSRRREPPEPRRTTPTACGSRKLNRGREPRSEDFVGIAHGFDQPLSGPDRGRVRCDAHVDQTPPAEGEDDEDVEHTKPGRYHREVVAGPSLVKMVPDERRPALASTAGQPRRSVLRYGSGRDAVTKLGQLAADHVLTPCRVVAPHATDEGAKVHVHGRAATGSARSPTPEQSPASTVPPDDGLGPDNQDGGKQFAEPPGQGRDQPPVAGLQERTLDLPVQDDDLLAQEEVLGDRHGGPRRQVRSPVRVQEGDHGGSGPNTGMAGQGTDLDEARSRGGWTFCSAKAR